MFENVAGKLKSIIKALFFIFGGFIAAYGLYCVVEWEDFLGISDEGYIVFPLVALIIGILYLTTLLSLLLVEIGENVAKIKEDLPNIGK